MTAALLALSLSACQINGMTEFTDYYIAFAPSSESYTEVNEQGELAGQYPIHFCTAKRSETVSVTVEVLPGDGLEEGVDYRVVTDPKVKFAPGVYDKTFIIEWLPHSLDSSKDNSLTLRLTDCSDASVVLGMPGPGKNNSEITIRKKKS